MQWLWIIAILAASYLLIYYLAKTSRFNAERHFILFIFRTGRGRDAISRLAERKRFWRAFGNLGALIGFLGMILVVYSIGFFLYSRYIQGVAIQGFQAVIPGVTIPFSYGVIGLASVLLVHEIAHGIIAIAEGIPVKSSGVVFLTALPIGAFVEPDEEEMKKKPKMSKLRVYAVGSFANILLFLAALSTIALFQSSFLEKPVVQIVQVTKGSPADGVLREGMVLKKIGDVEILDLNDFRFAAEGIIPDTDLAVTTDDGTFVVHTTEKADNPEEGYVGIGVQMFAPVKEWFGKHVYFALFWIAFLNQGIGLVNLAPLHFGIAATDGHYMLREVISKFVGEARANALSLIISGAMLVAVVFSIINPFDVLLG